MKDFFAQFGILFSLGILGTLVILWEFIPQIPQQLKIIKEQSLPPLWVILSIQVLQGVIFLSIAISIGILCTRSLQLHSRLIDQFVFHRLPSVPLGEELKWSLGLGLITTVVVLLIDYLLQPYLPPSFQSANAVQPSFLDKVLNGGLTEEIMFRWGVMSVLVWVGWKIVRHGQTLPSPWIYQVGIVLAALLFGLGHLPATAVIAPLTPLLVGRAVILNGLAGITCGWLFWQYSLEAAMLAHMTFHVVSSIVTLIFK